MRGDTLYEILTHYSEYRGAFLYYKKVHLHTRLALLSILFLLPLAWQNWSIIRVEFTFLYFLVILGTYNNFQKKISNSLADAFLNYFHKNIWEQAFLFKNYHQDLKRIVKWSLSSHGTNLQSKIKNNHNYEENI